MKNHISVEKAIKENGLTISRITVQRNIKRMKEEGNQDLSVIEFYQDVYVPNFQKPEMPEYIKHTIDSFPERQVKMKNEFEDLYHKLYLMNEMVEACGGNFAEATRKINSGQTRIRRNQTNFETRINEKCQSFSKNKEPIRRKNKGRKRRRREVIWQNIHQ